MRGARRGTVHVRITRGSSDPGRYDEVAALAHQIAEAVTRMPGCRGYTGGTNRTTGAVFGFSRWDSAEAAEFSRDQLGDLVPHLLALGVRLEAPDIYEVVVDI
jgi:quinol monooxygenase YgiN